MNSETYPASLFPLRGDLFAESGATTVEVIGLQNVLIAPQPFLDGASLTYVQANNDLEWLPNIGIFNEGNTYFVSLMAGDVLVYDGTDWTNAPLPSIASGGYFDINDGTFLIPQSSFTFDDSTF